MKTQQNKNKILNKASGRYVLKTGKIGKNIMKERKEQRLQRKQQKVQRIEKTNIADLRKDIARDIDYATQLMDDGVETNFLNIINAIETETKARYNLMNNNSIEAGFELVKYGGLSYEELQKMRVLLDAMALKGNVLFILTLDDATRTEKHYTMNKENRDQLMTILSQGGLYNSVYSGHGSDGMVESFGAGVLNIKVERLWDNRTSLFGKRSNQADFFKRMNMSDIDLTRYQIIRKSDNMELIDEQCLLYALRQLKTPEEYLLSITSHIKFGSYIAKKSLHKIAEIIKKNIIVRQYATRGKDTSNSQKMEKFITNEEYETIQLCMYDDHYFIYEKMDITEYAIKNYTTLKDVENFENITFARVGKTKTTYTRGLETSKADNLFVIRQLDLQGYFKDDELLKKTAQATTIKNTISLDNIENEQKLYEYKPKDDEEATIFFADTETDTGLYTGGAHTPLLIGCAKMRDYNTMGSTMIFERTDSVHNMVCRFLDYIIKQSKTKKIYVYFHNLKYDLMILLANIWLMDAPCEKDGQIYSVKILYKKRIIEFRDTYKLIPCALSKFCETFNLPKDIDKKEYIGYGYYRTTNQPHKDDTKEIFDSKVNVKISEYIKHLKIKDIEPFMKLLIDDKCGLNFGYNDEEQTFQAWEYYKYYLRYDVFVLMEGMKVFKTSINTMTKGKMNLFNYLTISSLTNSFYGYHGCFDGLYQVTGQLRDFIGLSIKGGRVCVNPKYERKVIEGRTSDYDGVSMYPSAIFRLCNEWGLSKGKCLKLNSMEELKDDYYYIIKVRITKINKSQQMPFVSYKDENDILQYTNDIPKCGFIETTVDRYTLEDWVLFQGIEYQFITGIYWNQGYNKKMGEITCGLFNDRLRYKSEKNDAMQSVIKLMLNSAYGKTLIKKSLIKKELIQNCNDEKRKNYKEIKERYYARINKKFHMIKTIEKLNDNQSVLVMDHYDDTYNLAFVGCAILSYSKRIMNEVFNVANDLKIPIYYTDTDSMHLPTDGIKPIEDAFRLKYGRELNGKQLCQFHVDFSLKGADDEIVAPRSLFLGKKTYIDELECVNKDGSIVKGLHYRMKGMTQEGIIHEAETNHGGDIFKLYEHLARHPTKMTLNPGSKFMVEYKGNRAYTRVSGKFTRVVDFRSKYEKDEDEKTE